MSHQPFHAFVRLRFSFAADADCKQIGDALDRLVRLRNEADYQLTGSRSFASNIKAAQAIALARDALSRLDGIQGDVIRQTAVIAAIQAAGS
jgi:hypothetical protein